MSRPHVYYFGLEPYEERYTTQLSGPDGWWERAAAKHGIAWTRIGGQPQVKEVRTGKVLDAHGRCRWALSQIANFVGMLQYDAIPDGSVVYLEDMWHPGTSAIPYVAALMGIKLHCYTRCHAQSVDPHDFTYPMHRWMRHYERALAAWMDRIFVASTVHQEMLVDCRIGPAEKFPVVGLPFDMEEVLERAGEASAPRKRRVIFISRWDDEKQPAFLLKVADQVHVWDPSVEFLATTSRPQDSMAFLRMEVDCEGTPVEARRVSKEGYYQALQTSAVQFNCALQDFVSYGLLEATTLGCHPVYPDYLSFPGCFEQDDHCRVLYCPWSVVGAARQILDALDRVKRLGHDWAREHFAYIPQQHSRTYERIFREMELL